MTIAEVSKNYEISADTLRYYERIGLLPPVPRTKSGIRDYDEDSLKWIQLMKCMRKAGVQIEALPVLLGKSQNPWIFLQTASGPRNPCGNVIWFYMIHGGNIFTGVSTGL